MILLQVGMLRLVHLALRLLMHLTLLTLLKSHMIMVLHQLLLLMLLLLMVARKRLQVLLSHCISLTLMRAIQMMQIRQKVTIGAHRCRRANRRSRH